MGIYINRGNGSFRSARRSDYVDKSALISFINGTINTENRFTCVSRARRFGKSMAARMLYAYYDKSSDSRKLFEDLRVADPANAANQNPDTAFETHLNKYPTLYIDIMDFDGVKQTIENLLIGNEEQVPVLNYGNDRNALESRDELFALLTHYGYFAYNLTHQTLRIPNQEVRAELLQVVKTGNRPELVQLIKQSDQLLEATLSMDEAYVAQALDTLHSQYTSPGSTTTSSRCAHSCATPTSEPQAVLSPWKNCQAAKASLTWRLSLHTPTANRSYWSNSSTTKQPIPPSGKSKNSGIPKSSRSLPATCSS